MTLEILQIYLNSEYNELNYGTFEQAITIYKSILRIKKIKKMIFSIPPNFSINQEEYQQIIKNLSIIFEKKVTSGCKFHKLYSNNR